MKSLLLRLSGAMLLSLFFFKSYSQIVGDDAFLKSTYVEMGINEFGVYIANNSTPAGYHATLGLLGIIADSDKDGWGTGSPNFCGDYFYPGSPEEGFAIQAAGTSYHNTYYGSPADASGGFTGYISSPSKVGATWVGNIAAANLQVTQGTVINTGGSVILSTIQLKNTGATTLNGVLYTRNADPDNEEQWTFDFTTNNIIVQNHPADPWAIVSATGLVYGCYFAMASKQSNAVASFGGFSTSSVIPMDAFNGFAPFSITGSTVADVAVQITFKAGNIGPGQTKVLNFLYATNPDDLEAVIGLTDDDVAHRMEAELNGTGDINYDPEFKISPNPTDGIIKLYGYGFSSTSKIELQIVNMLGQNVFSQQFENTTGIIMSSIQLDNNLQNGTYIANFLVDGKPYSQPFILNK